jgi:hypothetical protein
MDQAIAGAFGAHTLLNDPMQGADTASLMRLLGVVHPESTVTRQQCAAFLAEQARALQDSVPPAEVEEEEEEVQGDDIGDFESVVTDWLDDEGSEVAITSVRQPDTECLACMVAPAAQCRQIRDLLPPLCPGECRALLCSPCHRRMLYRGDRCPVCNRHPIAA